MARCLDLYSLTPEQLATLTPEEYAGLPVQQDCPSESSESLSSESAGDPCGALVLATHGRQGIGVVQPESGIDFPLIRPSEDVRYLLADFYMSFDQPSDYRDVKPFALPFSIKWLYGFGCEEPDFPIPGYDVDSSEWSSRCSTSSSSLSSSESVEHTECMPIPRNAHDIIVVDRNGKTVFDSTRAHIAYEARDWGERLRVVRWEHETDGSATIVYHTAWNPNDDPEPRNYPVYFFPDSAVIDERAVERLPKRVRSFGVVLDRLRGSAVDFVSGYNMLLERGVTSEEVGERRQTRVVFNATPGEGIGVFPGCEPEQLVVRRINGVAPTEQGDFYMAATNCYWVRQPTKIVSGDPRETLPLTEMSPGNIPIAGLPHPDAGTEKNLPGWPPNDDPRYAHLQLGSDCPPCCDCPDYVAVAEYMNKERHKYHNLGVGFEDIRNTYHANRERWLTSLDCFLRRPLRIKLLPQLCPFMDVAIQFCNQSDECQINLELSVTFTTSPQGGVATEVPGFTFITGARNRQGRTSPMTERYQMGGAWPTFTAFFDAVQPGQSVHARFRLGFDDCGVFPASASSSASNPTGEVPIAVTGCLTATVDGGQLEVPTTGSEPATEPAEVCETQTLNCPPEQQSTTNLLTCVCKTET